MFKYYVLIILYFIEVKKYQMTAGKGGYDEGGGGGAGYVDGRYS